ncbi:Holliday junction branch migration protein RuvA [Bacteroidetes/Chlorobi group bacterium MS-B_bin-24]|jgi:Holliday junction DNA helicase RuvA|nr:MAG: Holliday junction branch migration protein RuvA [Bacteroidetes/Chlorobi group bacterium MS-B_bin-24]
MFSFIKGKVVRKTGNSIEIETNGLGFEVQLSLNSLAKVGDVGDEVSLHTFVMLRDEIFQIYGFSSLGEKEIFKELISIPGIGTRIALGILSYFEVDEFVNCVKRNDLNKLIKLPGIGRKTAERILLEFREKVNKISLGRAEHIETKDENVFIETVTALNVLGFPENKTRTIVRDLIRTIPADSLTVENLVRQALQILNK